MYVFTTALFQCHDSLSVTIWSYSAAAIYGAVYRLGNGWPQVSRVGSFADECPPEKEGTSKRADLVVYGRHGVTSNLGEI